VASPDRIQRRLDVDLVDGKHRRRAVNVSWDGHHGSFLLVIRIGLASTFRA